MKPSQLSSLLSVTIPEHLPILIKGAPGIGKTDIIKQACIECNAHLVISHPVVCDPIDFKGMPFIHDGQAEFLPFGDLRALVEAQELTVFFMDDLGQAPPSVQAAAMQLILGRRVNGHHVSDQVTFVAATNRKSDKASVSGILEPVKSRFSSIVELQADLDDWVQWALNNGIPTELIAFIRFRPNLLHDFKPTSDITNSPCPRTIANVGRLLSIGIPPEIEYEVISGSAGEGFAAEFLAFLKIFRQLPNPDLVLMNPETADVPDDPATLYALCGALARKASDQTADRLFRYANRLPVEFSVLLTTDALKLHPEIVNTRVYINWCVNHKEVML